MQTIGADIVAKDWLGQGLNHPVQQRSRRTLGKLITAAESLLESGSFDAASVTDIVELADTSVGAFYARFKNKNALFLLIFDRFREDSLNWVRSELSPAGWQGRSLAEAARFFTQSLIDWYLENRGLIRAVFLHTRIHPDPDVQERMAGFNRETYHLLVSFFMVFELEIRGEDPRATIRFGCEMIAAFLRETLIFGPDSVKLKPKERKRLEVEASRGLRAYLTSGEMQ